MASKRGNPTVSSLVSSPEQDAHETKLSDMHSALHTLSDKIRKPFPQSGNKLLPKRFHKQEPQGAKAARTHIDALHKAMKGEK